MNENRKLSPGQVANRFLEIDLYDKPPMQANLSGLGLEFVILQIYSKDAGKREASIGFSIGHGSQDLGFRNNITVLFDCWRSVKVRFNVLDEDGRPTMASFIITDGIERIHHDSAGAVLKSPFRLSINAGR